MHVGGIFCDLAKNFYFITPELLLAKLHLYGFNIHGSVHRSMIREK